MDMSSHYLNTQTFLHWHITVLVNLRLLWLDKFRTFCAMSLCLWFGDDIITQLRRNKKNYTSWKLYFWVLRALKHFLCMEMVCLCIYVCVCLCVSESKSVTWPSGGKTQLGVSSLSAVLEDCVDEEKQHPNFLHCSIGEQKWENIYPPLSYKTRESTETNHSWMNYRGNRQ